MKCMFCNTEAETEYICDECVYACLEEKSPKKETLPIVLDIDLVRELKNTGHYKEALRLIDAHQKNLKKNREKLKKELKYRVLQARNTALYRQGICITCGKKPVREGNKYFCLECHERRKKTQREHYHKKKEAQKK